MFVIEKLIKLLIKLINKLRGNKNTCIKAYIEHSWCYYFAVIDVAATYLVSQLF